MSEPVWLSKQSPLTQAIVSRLMLLGLTLFELALAQASLHVMFEGSERERLADRQPWAFIGGLAVGTLLIVGWRKRGWLSNVSYTGGTAAFVTVLAWGLVIADAYGALFLCLMVAAGSMIPVVIWGSKYPFPPRSTEKVHPAAPDQDPPNDPTPA